MSRVVRNIRQADHARSVAMSVSNAPIPSPAGSAWDESAAWYPMPPNVDDRRSRTRTGTVLGWCSRVAG